MSDYYDREELTRPGHEPQLVSGRAGWAQSSCSCGWRFDVGTLTDAARAVNEHISEVDATA